MLRGARTKRCQSLKMSSIDFKLHTNVGQPSLYIMCFKLISDMLIWWFFESFQKHLWNVFKMAAKYMSCLTEQKCIWSLTLELFYFIALNFWHWTFTLPSFMLELATFPSEKFENLCNLLSSNDTLFTRELKFSYKFN